MFSEAKFDPLLLILLGIGGVAVLGTLIFSSYEDTMTFPYDAVLRERMDAVGLSSWQTLQTQAQIGRSTLIKLRKGEIKELSLQQIEQVAAVLGLSESELMGKLGFAWAEQPQDEAPARPDASEDLQAQVEQLRDRLLKQESSLTSDLRELTFQQLQTLLTNFPSARKMVESKPDLPAKNIVPLFTPLEGLISSWGYEVIGQAWESVEYNPQIHQADSDEIQPGETVYVRFVGYRSGERTLCPAKVSLTLPGGVQ